MRAVSILPLVGALALAACSSGENGEAAQTVNLDGDPDMPAPQAPEVFASSDAQNEEGVTPVAERVATLGLLNKRNNVSEDIEMRPGESRELGPVIIKLDNCERTAPWEFPQETGAFVQVDIREPRQSDHTRVFSGWLFKESPSLNVVEHPIYDVWVKDCAMSFPGES